MKREKLTKKQLEEKIAKLEEELTFLKNKKINTPYSHQTNNDPKKEHSLILNASDDIIMLIDSHLDIVEINENCLSFFNKKEIEILGMKYYSIVYKKNKPEDNCPLIKSQRTKNIESSEFINIATGKYISLKSVPVKNKEREIAKFIVIIKDISLLKERENKFTSLFNNINMGVALHEIITDENNIPIDFIFLDANPTYEKLTHLKVKDIIGKRGLEIIPNLEKKWINVYGKVAQTGESLTIIDHSEYLNCYWEIKAFSPKKNQFAVALTDITDQKNSEIKLKQNEKTFRSIIELSPIAIFVYTLDDNGNLIFTNYNKAANKALGFDNSQFVGKTIEEAFPPLVGTEIPYRYKQAAMYGETWHTEQVDYSHKGISGAFEIYAFQISQGKVAIMFKNIFERKQNEEKILIEKNKAQSFLDIANIIIVSLNLNGNISLINRKGCEILGYSQDEIIGKNWFNYFIHPKIKKIVQNVFNDIIKGEIKQIEYFENSIITKSKKERIIAWHNTLLKDTEGNITGILSSGEDITDRKLAQEALRKNEAIYRTTLYSIGDGVISTEMTGNILHMNSVAEKLTGWSEKDAIGCPINKVFKIINEQTRIAEKDPVERILKRGQTAGLANHTLLISKNGNEIPIADSGAPIKNEKGEITGIVLVFRDQTEERLNQQIVGIRLSLIEYSANHSLDELLTNALDKVGSIANSPIGFYHFVEPDQKTLSLQQWSTRTLEEYCKTDAKGIHYSIDKAGVWVDCVYQKKPVVHNNYETLSHKKGLPEGHAQLKRELVVPVMRKNKVVAILGIGNKPTEYTAKDIETVSYLADITWQIVKQKKAEEDLLKKNKELIKAKNKAEESDRLKSAFLTNMSHEIRTPMNGIIGFSGMFLNPRLSNDKRSHYAKIVVESSKQLLNIVNDILDISMIETNTIKLNSEEIVVNELIRNLFDFFNPQLKKEVSLEIKTPLNDTESIIIADKIRLQQILTNLISNALKFTKKGYIRVGYNLVPEYLQFFVEDSGIGIPKPQTNKIFERFRQVDMDATRKYGGNGLGLSISKKLVELLGGNIWVKSELNKGSVFYFTIPYNTTLPLNK